MNMEIDRAIELIDQTASDDLERCLKAVRAGDQAVALEALGQAISRLGAARDALQDIPRQARDLGLQAML
jgi:hypothetical protein